MVPEGLRGFFTASTGASATLLGLLFVAIAVEPNRIFGERSPVESRSRASSAYTALINIFFISLLGTIPASGLRYLPVILAALGLAHSLRIGLNLWRESRRWRSFLSSGVGLLLGSTVAYGLELCYGWQIIRYPTNKQQMYNLAFVLFGVYAIALGRAWELLGAPERGWLRPFFSRRSVDEGRKENLGGDDPE